MKKGNVSIASLRLDKDYRIGEAKDTLYGDFHQTSPEVLGRIILMKLTGIIWGSSVFQAEAICVFTIGRMG